MIELFRSAFQYFVEGRSPRWNKLRLQHLEKEPFCQWCLTKENLEVHHIEPVSQNPKRELDPTNLITLCSHDHLVCGHLGSFHSWNEHIREDCNKMQEKIRNRP